MQKVMNIEVLYFADFKDIVGKDKEICNIENNLKDLIDLLIDKYQPIKKLIWDEKINNFKSSIKLAINDKLIIQENLLKLPLSEGDRVAFLMPLSGG